MRKAFLRIGIVLAILAAMLAGGYGYVSHKAERLPKNNPEAFRAGHVARPGQKVVVCAGDSLTHGAVSVNYVDILAARYPDGPYVFVNAGVNSSLAYNLKTRLDAIVRCDPDCVAILIGTNDANASLSGRNAERLVRKMHLPRTPDREWFRLNLSEVCATLKARTHARIALMSLPPIGEEPDSEAFRRAEEYSAIIREVAASQRVAYLPLNEAMSDEIRRRGKAPSLSYRGDTNPALYRSLARHFFLGRSFDEISRENGFLFLVDLLHLNTRGATRVADLVEAFVTQP